MKRFTPIIFLITLSACQGQADKDNRDKASLNTAAVIQVNMTFDRDIDFQVTDIAAVPNNVAPWAGSLFVIDDMGVLQRGDIESGAFKTVANNIKAFAPLSRANKAGLLITLGMEKQIKGYYEINDASDYRNIPLAQSPSNITHFCTQNILSEDRIYGRDKNGDIFALDIISPEDNGFFNSAKINAQNADHKTDCAVHLMDKAVELVELPSNALDSAVIGPGRLLFTTDESLTRPRMFMRQGQDITAIDITGGLSTLAPARIDNFYVIPNSLGGSLRDGAVIIADNESNRLVYISLGFLKTRLNEIAIDQSEPAN